MLRQPQQIRICHRGRNTNSFFSRPFLPSQFESYAKRIENFSTKTEGKIQRKKLKPLCNLNIHLGYKWKHWRVFLHFLSKDIRFRESLECFIFHNNNIVKESKKSGLVTNTQIRWLTFDRGICQMPAIWKIFWREDFFKKCFFLKRRPLCFWGGKKSKNVKSKIHWFLSSSRSEGMENFLILTDADYK